MEESRHTWRLWRYHNRSNIADNASRLGFFLCTPRIPSTYYMHTPVCASLSVSALTIMQGRFSERHCSAGEQPSAVVRQGEKLSLALELGQLQVCWQFLVPTCTCTPVNRVLYTWTKSVVRKYDTLSKYFVWLFVLCHGRWWCSHWTLIPVRIRSVCTMCTA